MSSGTMNCKEIYFSGHALRRIFERAIPSEVVVWVARHGGVICEYPDDLPHPSVLLLGFVEGRAIHVVLAQDKTTGICFVITAYEPDPLLWTDDYERRR